MDQGVVCLMAFIKTRQVTSPLVESLVAAFGEQRTTVISIQLLSWLKSQKRIGKTYPLTIYSHVGWAQDAWSMIETHKVLDGLVQRNGNKLEWLPGLDPAVIDDVTGFVDREYIQRRVT